MTNDEWLFNQTAVYRGRVRGMRRTDILAEIATSLHEIAQQLAEQNGYVDPKSVPNPMRAVRTAPPLTNMQGWSIQPIKRSDENGW